MKKLAILAFAFITMAACASKKAQPPAATENEKLVTRYFEYFNRHQWAEMAEMYSATAAFKDPSLGPGIVMQTRQQVRDKYTELNNTFPDVHDKIVQLYPSGNNHVIAEFISSGTAPDNSKFELPVCTVFTIENGKITKDFTYYDNFEDPEDNQK